MNAILIKELRTKSDEIREIEATGNQEETERGRKLLRKSMETALSLISDIYGVRRNSIKKLSQDLCEMENSDYKYLGHLVRLVVDKYSLDAIEKLGTARYFSVERKAYEGLSCLIFLVGFHMAGTHSPIEFIEEMMLSMIPVSLAEEYRREHPYEEKEDEIDYEEMSEMERILFWS